MPVTDILTKALRSFGLFILPVVAAWYYEL
jgi:hypothetical protein